MPKEYLAKIKDEKIRKFAEYIEDALENTEDPVKKRELLAKFILDVDEKLKGREAHLRKVTKKVLKTSKVKSKLKNTNEIAVTKEAINILANIKTTLNDAYKKLDIRKPNKKAKKQAIQKEKTYQTLVSQIKVKSTLPQWYTPKAELRLLDSDKMSDELNIQDTQTRVKLRDSFERFNHDIQMRIEKSVRDNLIATSLTVVDHPEIQISIKHMTKVFMDAFEYGESVEKVRVDLLKAANTFPKGALIQARVPELIEKLSAQYQHLEQVTKISSLSKVVEILPNPIAVKQFIQKILSKDQNGTYRSTVIPELVTKLKYMRNKIDNQNEMVMLQAKLSAIHEALHPSFKTRQSLILSGGNRSSAIFQGLGAPGERQIQVQAEASVIKPVQTSPLPPTVDKSSPFYKFMESLNKVGKGGGLGQEYAKENAQYNSLWRSLFRKNDVINTERIEQLNEIQRVVNSIQADIAVFKAGAVSEAEQKWAAEVLYWKLFEIRDQANNGENMKKRSIPLEKVCQKWMDEIDRKGLRPHRGFHDAMENNPLVKQVYIHKPHTSFMPKKPNQPAK